MWVKNYMCDWVNTVSPDKTVSEAVELMVKNKTNGMIVVDENETPIGIISSLGLIRQVVPSYFRDASFSKFGAEGTFDRYAEKLKDKTVEEVMLKDFHCLSEKDAMIEAAAYAAKSQLRMIPVTDQEGNKGRLIGVITRTCIKNALYNAIHKDKQIDPHFKNDRGDHCSCLDKKDEEKREEK